MREVGSQSCSSGCTPYFVAVNEKIKAVAGFDFEARAQQKRDSRRADSEALASGQKSRDVLRRENGHFAHLDAVIDFEHARSL